MSALRVDEAELDRLASRFGEREQRDPERYPAENIADLQAAGIVAAPFSAPLGGRDWSLPDAVIAVEAIAARSPSTALVLSMPLGLAGIYALGPGAAPEQHRAAWAEQIERVASQYAEGL